MFLDIVRWVLTNLRWTSAIEAEEAYRDLYNDRAILPGEGDEKERKIVRQVLDEQRRSDWLSRAPFV